MGGIAFVEGMGLPELIVIGVIAAVGIGGIIVLIKTLTSKE